MRTRLVALSFATAVLSTAPALADETDAPQPLLTLEQTVANVDQAATSPEQAAENAEQAPTASEQAADSQDQAATNSEQDAGSPEQAPAVSEHAAEGPDQAATSTDQTAGSTEQAPAAPVQAAVSQDQAATNSEQAAGSADQAPAVSEQATVSPDDAATSTEQTAEGAEQATAALEQAVTSAEQPAEFPDQAVGSAVRQMLEAESGKDDAAERRALIEFYAARADRPLWIDGNKLSAKAEAVIAEISRADEWGLDAKDFQLPEAIAPDGSETERRDQLANAEMMLSRAVLKYARYARGGRITAPAKDLSSYLDRRPQLKEPATVLEEIAAADEADAYLRDLHPKHPQFAKLRAALAKIRNFGDDAQKEKQVRLPSEGPILSLGRRHPDVALLRERLKVPAPVIEGEDKPAEVFDEALHEAVEAFQREAGISVDGVVGRRTRAALNGDSPTEVSEASIIANMEQWRWMPDDLGEFHIAVNLPEYTLRVVREGEVVHSERVIIGEVGKQTPVFSDEMETVVFHPVWGVPDSIKVNEILPSLARGGNALSRHNLRVQYNGRDIDPQTIDWSQSDIRKFHIYQPPGGGNVLGQVKFLFPNKHQVYMHDTPTKNLFNASQRTFSHGCMRVRDPLRLAELILDEDRGWGSDKVQSLVRGGPTNNHVTLGRKVPVHITYFTVVANDDGTVTTFNDVYGHEKRIRLALEGRFDQIARHRDHLAPVTYDRSRYANIKKPQADTVADIFKAVFGGF